MGDLIVLISYCDIVVIFVAVDVTSFSKCFYANWLTNYEHHKNFIIQEQSFHFRQDWP